MHIKKEGSQLVVRLDEKEVLELEGLMRVLKGYKEGTPLLPKRLITKDGKSGIRFLVGGSVIPPSVHREYGLVVASTGGASGGAELDLVGSDPDSDHMVKVVGNTFIHGVGVELLFSRVIEDENEKIGFELVIHPRLEYNVVTKNRGILADQGIEVL